MACTAAMTTSPGALELEDAIKAQANSGNQSVLDLARQLQVIAQERRRCTVRSKSSRITSRQCQASARHVCRPRHASAPLRAERTRGAGPRLRTSTRRCGTTMAPALRLPRPSRQRMRRRPTKRRKTSVAWVSTRVPIVAFQEFIAQYPKSSLAHRASTGSATLTTICAITRTRLRTSRRWFRAYPDSASVPDALLNIASSQIELGDTVAARKPWTLSCRVTRRARLPRKPDAGSLHRASGRDAMAVVHQPASAADVSPQSATLRDRRDFLLDPGRDQPLGSDGVRAAHGLPACAASTATPRTRSRRKRRTFDACSAKWPARHATSASPAASRSRSRVARRC